MAEVEPSPPYKSFDWKDVNPIAHFDGEVPLARISYSPEYKEAMELLRAVMAAKEYSPRALKLTEAVIELNPAHYSVYQYRYDILKHIGRDVIEESLWFVPDSPSEASSQDYVVEDFEWVNQLTLDNPKNYQVWGYRQLLKVPNCTQYYREEKATIKMALEEDSKNYHAWSHLQWVIKNCTPATTNYQTELDYTVQLLSEDVRNNSAWSYRHFVHEHYSSISYLTTRDTFELESQYVLKCIELAPQNESAWNYLTAIYEKTSDIPEFPRLDSLESSCLKYAPISEQENEVTEVIVESTPALELLVQIYVKLGRKSASFSALDLLQQYVPMRRGYWKYLRQEITASSLADNIESL